MLRYAHLDRPRRRLTVARTAPVFTLHEFVFAVAEVVLVDGARVAKVLEQHMPRGTVKCFSDAKGYGFITRDDGREAFVHYSSVATEGFRTLTAGQVVDYDEQEGPRGIFALRVTVVL